MATMRTVGLVAVGVDLTAGLPRLAGAASGAARMADWLRGQRRYGVEPIISELTDAGGAKVSARQVQDAVRGLVDRGDLDLLILYFAGHGIVKSGGDEQVLLSDVGQYKDEAIAIAPTVLNARYSTVPHVIVVSDACRNAVDPFGQFGTVAGKPALERRAVVGVRKSKVDEFYATEPSQTAKEAGGEGFFTELLLQALNDPPSTVWEVWDDPAVAVVPTWKLEDYLGVEVPLRAASHDPPFSQTPDFQITSREPKFFGYAQAKSVTRAKPPQAGDARSALARQLSLRKEALEDVGSFLASDADLRRAADAAAAAGAGLGRAFHSYVGSDCGREAFETYTGYSVVGCKVEKVMLSGGLDGESVPGGEGRHGTDVRLHPPPFGAGPHGQRGSVALFFAGGTVCILPILPGCIGTLHVEGGRVASLSFEVSAQLRGRLGESEEEGRVFAGRRALAAALSASGKLRRLAGPQGRAHAGVLRQSKRADPTLGIYAAYAYALSGDDEGARSVNGWFRGYPPLDDMPGFPPSPVPFDVAMLARDLSPAAASQAPGIAPFCPLMTLGWSLLPSYIDEGVLHPAIAQAGSRRLNAEWTTFRRQDVRAMLDAFEKGELQ